MGVTAGGRYWLSVVGTPDAGACSKAVRVIGGGGAVGDGNGVGNDWPSIVTCPPKDGSTSAGTQATSNRIKGKLEATRANLRQLSTFFIFLTYSDIFLHSVDHFNRWRRLLPGCQKTLATRVTDGRPPIGHSPCEADRFQIR